LIADADPLPDLIASLHRDTASLQSRLSSLDLAAQQDALRAHLSSDHPCPVCGSLDHPFAGTDPSDHDLASQRALTQRDLSHHQRALIDAQAQLKSP
jgi:DNA repair exonuclease SbcCD ATPase subunit